MPYFSCLLFWSPQLIKVSLIFHFGISGLPPSLDLGSILSILCNYFAPRSFLVDLWFFLRHFLALFGSSLFRSKMKCTCVPKTSFLDINRRFLAWVPWIFIRVSNILTLGPRYSYWTAPFLATLTPGVFGSSWFYFKA